MEPEGKNCQGWTWAQWLNTALFIAPRVPTRSERLAMIEDWRAGFDPDLWLDVLSQAPC